MAILTSKELKGIKIIPEYNGYTNVVRVAIWDVHFYDETYPDIKTLGTVETLLEYPSDTFVSIDTATQSQILEWAYTAQGGDAFLEQLRPAHEEHLAYLLQVGNVQDYDISNIAQ